MKTPIDTEEKNINYYSDAIKSSADKNVSDFLRWFNNNDNVNSVINSGYYDFYTSILKPTIYEKTKNNSKQLTGLEIGCGGGRILNAACKYFAKAIGVDIHDSFDALNNFLTSENENFELGKIKDNKIPTKDKSVDFVYSFIVFQHILKIKVFEDYVSEIKRMLKPDGITIIYFGRPRFFSKKVFYNKTLNNITRIFDKIFYEILYLNIFKNGFIENYNAEVNHVNLTVSIFKAKKIFKKAGLKIKEKGISKNKNIFGTQYYFIAEHSR